MLELRVWHRLLEEWTREKTKCVCMLFSLEWRFGLQGASHEPLRLDVFGGCRVELPPKPGMSYSWYRALALLLADQLAGNVAVLHSLGWVSYVGLYGAHGDYARFPFTHGLL